MSAKAQSKKSGGGRKIGRNKRPKDQLMSAYVRNKINFEQYSKSQKKDA